MGQQIRTVAAVSAIDLPCGSVESLMLGNVSSPSKFQPLIAHRPVSSTVEEMDDLFS